MAIIKYLGKQWSGDTLELRGNNIYVDGILVHTIKGLTGGLGVKVQGNINYLQVSNTADICGTVDTASAENSISVAGGILESAVANNRVIADKIVQADMAKGLSEVTAKVAIKKKRNSTRNASKSGEELSKFIHDSFGINSMDTKLKRRRTTYINVVGNINKVLVDNCCTVKGNVYAVKAGNSIKITGIVLVAQAKNCIQTDILSSAAKSARVTY